MAIEDKPLAISPDEIRILYRQAIHKVNELSGLREEDLSLIEKVALRMIAVNVFEGGFPLQYSGTESAVKFLSTYFDYAPNPTSVFNFDKLRRLKWEQSGIDVLREHFKIQSKKYHKP